MSDSDQEHERKAIELAERRATATAQIEAHLSEHDRRLERIGESVADTTASLRAVEREVGSLRAEFKQSLAITAARAQDAQALARKQVTSRELYVTAFGVVVALVSALAAGGVFG